MKSVQEIVDLASAYYGSAVLFAAIDCDGFAQVEAGTFDASARGLRLLADACVAEGLLEKRDGRYFNTPAAKAALVPGGPADLTKAIRYNRDVYPAWGKLAEFARTGKPVERPEIHLGEDAARTKAFAAAMFTPRFPPPAAWSCCCTRLSSRCTSRTTAWSRCASPARAASSSWRRTRSSTARATPTWRTCAACRGRRAATATASASP